MLARFAEGFRAPRPERAAVQVAPKIRMQHPMLQVPVGGADGRFEPRRHENTERRDVIRVNIEKPKNLRLRIAEGVKDSPWFEGAALRQVHNKLHADGIIVFVMAGGEAELFVELPANWTNRTIADDGQRGANIHAGGKAVGGVALLVCPLVHEADAGDFIPFHQRFGDGGARPDLNRSGAHQLGADPLVELPDGQHQPAMLLQIGRDVRQLECGMVAFKGAQEFIRYAQR